MSGRKSIPTPDSLGLKWYPVPRRPWHLVRDDGSTFKNFDDVETAQRWLERNGFEFDVLAAAAEFEVR